MRLYIVRHGQSTNNRLSATTGSEMGRSEDPELTEIGILQAQAVATVLAGGSADRAALAFNNYDIAGFGITHLYCSLMVRAVHTASIIGAELGLRPVPWEDVHEVGGIYLDMPNGLKVGQAGKNRSYFERHFPTVRLPPDLSEEGWYRSKPFESHDAVPVRAERWYRELMARHGESADHVAVVSHGAFLAHFIRLVSKMPSFVDHPFWFEAANCSITRIDFESHMINVRYVNRFDFLQAHLVT